MNFDRYTLRAPPDNGRSLKLCDLINVITFYTVR